MDTQKKILDIVNKNLNVIEYNKKSRGEVFTNLKLVDKQVSHVPIHVFKKQQTKWLDIGSGLGNYSIYCYFKLMKTLTQIRDKEKRSIHIIENMLYMIEIDDVNVEKCIEIFKLIEPKAQINIIQTDFLKLKEKDLLEHKFPLKYNVILSNPPYNQPNKKDINKLSTRALYPHIISYALTFLQPKGYLSFIHPVSWRRYSREHRFDFDKYDILYMYTNNQFTDFDNSAPYINYYTLCNTCKPKHLTEYETEFDGTIYRGKAILKKLPFIPLLLHTYTLQILDKLFNYDDKDAIPLNIKLISSNSTSKNSISSSKTSIFKYKNIHNYSILHKKYIYRYSIAKHPSHNLRKIIMIYRGGWKYFQPFYDDGTIGITDNALFVEVEDKKQGDIVLNFLKSDIVTFVLKTCNFNYGRNMKNEYKILNRLNVPLTKKLHIQYNFTKEEINFIKQI